MAAAPTLVIQIVLPSGSALSVSIAPMAPFAPGRFSTSTGRPSARANDSASVRATKSTGPPGAKATIRRTGRPEGCARARPPKPAATAPAIRNQCRLDRCAFIRISSWVTVPAGRGFSTARRRARAPGHRRAGCRHVAGPPVIGSLRGRGAASTRSRREPEVASTQASRREVGNRLRIPAILRYLLRTRPLHRPAARGRPWARRIRRATRPSEAREGPEHRAAPCAVSAGSRAPRGDARSVRPARMGDGVPDGIMPIACSRQEASPLGRVGTSARSGHGTPCSIEARDYGLRGRFAPRPGEGQSVACRPSLPGFAQPTGTSARGAAGLV